MPPDSETETEMPALDMDEQLSRAALDYHRLPTLLSSFARSQLADPGQEQRH